MDRRYRWIAAFAAAAVLLTLLPFGGLAAEDETEFIYSGITAPSEVTHNVDNSYRHSGSGTKAVHYYGYGRKPEQYTDDLFAEGYNYMCYGTGRTTAEYSWNNFTVRFPNDLTELSAGDALYFSFYYRSAPAFEGADGSGSYTGQETLPTLRFNDKSTPMYELASGRQSGSAGCITFQPDGQWHKAEYYVPVTAATSGVQTLGFWICYMQMEYACSIDMAGFSYGVLKPGGGITPSNEAYYTLLGWELNRGALTSLTVDGRQVALQAGVTEYTADADAVGAVVSAQGTGAVEPAVIQKDDFTYEITAYAAGYDTLIDEERQYIQRTAADGSFDQAGTDAVYTAANASRTQVYTVHLNVKPVTASLFVNGQETAMPYACAAGEQLEIREVYNNFTDEARTFMTLLVFYKDGQLFRIVPYKTELSPLENDRREQFFYTPDLTDYDGVTCDMMIMDTENFADVLK